MSVVYVAYSGHNLHVCRLFLNETAPVPLHIVSNVSEQKIAEASRVY